MAGTGRRYVWRDLTRLTGWNIAGHWVMAAGSLALGLWTLWLGEAGTYEDHAVSVMTRTQLQQFWADMAWICAWLPSLILALYWGWRASENAHVLDKTMRHSPAAAVYWYFVPFAFLIMPFRVMKEIWQVAAGGRSTAAPNIMRAWWALSLLSNGLAALSAFSILPGLSRVLPEATLVGLASLIGALSSAAAAVMIRRLHAMLTTSQVSSIFADEPSPGLASVG